MSIAAVSAIFLSSNGLIVDDVREARRKLATAFSQPLR